MNKAFKYETGIECTPINFNKFSGIKCSRYMPIYRAIYFNTKNLHYSSSNSLCISILLKQFNKEKNIFLRKIFNEGSSHMHKNVP